MKKWILLMFIVFLTGCSTEHLIHITPIETSKPIDADLGGAYKSVQLKKVVCDLPSGKILGHINGQAGSPLVLDPSTEALFEKGIKRHFYKALNKSGYRCVGEVDSLFDEYETERADIIVGAKILDFRQNRKMIAQLFDWKMTIEQYLEIEWQLYSRHKKAILATYSSRGYQKDSLVFTGTAPVTDYIDHLISNAVTNLLANPEFITMIEKDKPKVTSSSKYQKYIIAKCENNNTPINENSSLIRSSVVTVKSSNGHGSGFVISTDGYALTNAHVVGSDSIVKVVLATGRECLADVLYRESERDVAIIKLEQDGLNALPISKGVNNIGDEVYAMGSPLDESLSSTLTKGIISAFRKTETGLEYIQSDVSIQQGNSGGPLLDKYGNVVGISVAGMFVNKTPMGLNFFIPIKDAIESVNIEMTD